MLANVFRQGIWAYDLMHSSLLLAAPIYSISARWKLEHFNGWRIRNKLHRASTICIIRSGRALLANESEFNFRWKCTDWWVARVFCNIETLRAYVLWKSVRKENVTRTKQARQRNESDSDDGKCTKAPLFPSQIIYCIYCPKEVFFYLRQKSAFIIDSI